jgi:hypothetical protein
VQSTYEHVWTDAEAAERAVLERTQAERSYRYMLGLTDDLLGHLERLNLDGQHDLDAVTRREIETMLGSLCPKARDRFPAVSTVREALDGLFEVQEELLFPLQRMVHYDHLFASPMARSA